MRLLKKYAAFMASPLLNILLILSPLLFVLISYFTQSLILLLFMFCLYIAIDSAIVFLNFGGLLSRKSVHNSYIKSSTEGLKILKTAILADTIRRFISFAIIVFSTLFGCFTKGNSSYTPTFQVALCITIVICLCSELISYWLLFITSGNMFVVAVYLLNTIMGILLAIYLHFENDILNYVVMATVLLYPLKFIKFDKKAEGLFYD